MKAALIITMVMFLVVGVVVLVVAVVGSEGLFTGSAATGGGIVTSQDGGKTWATLGVIEGEKQRSIAVIDILDFRADPQNDDVMYIGSNGTGLLKSTDRGATWRVLQDEAGLVGPAAYVPRVAVSRNDPNILYVPVVQNNRSIVAKSIDGGKSFTQIYLSSTPGERIFAIAADFYNPFLVYMVTNTGLFLKSFDGGASWQFANKFPGGAKDLLVSRKDELYLVGFDGSVQRSTDQGNSWAAIDIASFLTSGGGGAAMPQGPFGFPLFGGGGARPAPLAFFAIDRNFDNTLYVGSGNKVYRSYDSGKTWQPMDLIVKTENVSVHSFVQDPASPHILYVGAGTYIYKSFDNGESWATYRVVDTPKIMTFLHIPQSAPESLFAVYNNGR